MLSPALFQQPAPPLSAAYQDVEWLGKRVELPPDWEIVSHSLSAERGSLRVVDRRRHRLELSWQRCRSEPDMQRLLADFRARELAQDPEAKLGAESLGGATARLEISTRGKWLTRLARYDARAEQLVELLVIAHAAPERAQAERILASFRLEPRDTGRFCAFGLDVTCSARLSPESVRALPAQVTLRLVEAAGGFAQAVVKRLGMASSWFRGDFEALARRELSKAQLVESVPVSVGDHPGTEWMARGNAPPLERWRGRQPRHRALAWHCPERNDVFWLEAQSRDQKPLLLGELTLRCCAAGAAGGRA